jgi:hypothetical protein
LPGNATLNPANANVGGCVVNTDSDPLNFCGTYPDFDRIGSLGATDAYVAIAVRNLTVSGPLRFVGERGVVLLVFGDMTLSNILDVSLGGAGADAGDCTPALRAGGSGESAPDKSASTGGGGGANALPGGDGGDIVAGEDDVAAGRGGRPGSRLVADGELPPGCSGGPAGKVGSGDPPFAGAGGGAIQVSVAGSLAVLGGSIDARGGGGAGGFMSGGGAGGGAGGSVLVQARAFPSGMPGCFVEGGGGGAGGSESSAGQPGLIGGPGGISQSGTAGGSGGVGAGTDGQTPTLTERGGGGGGGSGGQCLIESRSQ